MKSSSTSGPAASPDAPPLLIVGEAFGKYSPGQSRPLYPYPATGSGGRLWDITGYTLGEYLHGTERANLFLDTPKKWDRGEASAQAKSLAWYAYERRQTLVLLGKKVTQAFGVPGDPFYDQLVLFPIVTAGRGSCGRVRAFVMPHTSGLCREWNTPGAREKAKAFFDVFRDSATAYARGKR